MKIIDNGIRRGVAHHGIAMAASAYLMAGAISEMAESWPQLSAKMMANRLISRKAGSGEKRISSASAYHNLNGV